MSRPGDNPIATHHRGAPGVSDTDGQWDLAGRRVYDGWSMGFMTWRRRRSRLF